MANFKDKIKNKKTIGNREINSDEALGLAFKDSDKKISIVKINALTVNPYQPRKSISLIELKELSNSIQSDGLLQPIVITPIQNNPNKFFIVAGHRRVEAHKLLGKKSIEAVIYQMNDKDMMINTIVENMQRENLTPIEEAFAIKRLLDSGMKQVEITDKIGKSKSYISQLIKISNLDKDLINYINGKALVMSISLLYEISRVSQDKQMQLLKQIEHKAMTREQIRNYIKKMTTTSPNKGNTPKNNSGFSFSNKKNKISFKLDLEQLEDTTQAIETLEKILAQLKKV